MATASVTYSFIASTLIESAKVNTDFSDLVSFLNNSVVHVDGSKAFTAVPSGPAANPTTANQFTRKGYIDGDIQTFTPGWTNVTLGAGVTNEGVYWVRGQTVHWAVRLVLGFGGAFTGVIQMDWSSSAMPDVDSTFLNLGTCSASFGNSGNTVSGSGSGRYKTDGITKFVGGHVSTNVGWNVNDPITWGGSCTLTAQGVYIAV